jgi:hypothetical protein
VSDGAGDQLSPRVQDGRFIRCFYLHCEASFCEGVLVILEDSGLPVAR